MGRQESLNDLMVSSGFRKELPSGGSVILGESGHECLADEILFCCALAIGFSLFFSYFRNIRSLRRRDYHHALHLVGMVPGDHYRDKRVFAKGNL